MAQDREKLRKILEQTRRIAVIGMKRGGAAYSIPKYMEHHGYEIVPVNPSYDEVGGLAAVDAVTDVEGPVDMVNVFRRSEAVLSHVDEILAMDPLPKTVWMQLGIRNEEAARKLEDAGIEVVQDRCLKVDHSRLL